MEHAWSRITAILLSAVIFCVIPLVIHMQRQENVVRLGIMTHTVQFVDAVRNSGRMTKGMYRQYENQVRGLCQGLHIAMLHTKTCLYADDADIKLTEKVCTEAEIIQSLYDDSEYIFQRGDFFRIEVLRSERGTMEQILGLNAGQDDALDVYVFYGGSIRYETGALVYRDGVGTSCLKCDIWLEV